MTKLFHIFLILSSFNGYSQELEVLFTNPNCPTQKFFSFKLPTTDLRRIIDDKPYIKFRDLESVRVPEGIKTLGGETRNFIPEGVTCRLDRKRLIIEPAISNPSRTEDSPHVRIDEWISSTLKDDSIFIATLRLADEEIGFSLCAALQRGVNIKIFLNKNTPMSRATKSLIACKNQNSGKLEVFRFSKERQLAHMKITLIESLNQDHPEEKRNKVRIAFGSGNYTLGLWANHENWVFMDISKDHWFVKDHTCLRDAIDEDSFLDGKIIFDRLDTCRIDHQIQTSRLNDHELFVFFLPNDEGRFRDKSQLHEFLKGEIRRSKSMDIAIHHLTYLPLLKSIKNRLDRGDFKVRLLLDDDIYWAKIDYSRESFVSNGRHFFNTQDVNKYCVWGSYSQDASKTNCSGFLPFELREIMKNLGNAEIRYLETSIFDGIKSHNKFIVFEYNEKFNDADGSVFTGSGNFSQAGFTTNFESFYAIRDRDLMKKYQNGFEKLWDRAVPECRLPITWDYKLQPQEIP